MESLLWGFRTQDTFQIVWPLALTFFICFTFVQSDFIFLLFNRFARLSFFGHANDFRPAAYGERPTGMVIIPSLLRNEDDFDAIAMTLESCAQNRYPSDLIVVASVDGRTEKPALYARLARFIAAHPCPAHVRLVLTGTETRLGKMMAVEAGVSFVKGLIARGDITMPAIYFSIDGDGTLDAHALERMAARLAKPHHLTGNPRRIVSGKICIRPDLFWQGWRALFTSKGILYMNVAREFVVSNVARHNWKVTPMVGVPGALYCCWSDLLVEAPRYMGFMKTLHFRDVVRWWLGFGAPKFSESTAPALPEALTGASDDTCMAFLASIATWQSGKMSFDAPQTPFHALGRMIRSYFFERSHDYEPEARVYTFTPNTWKALWVQRVRWNASRFECAGRFWRSFWFHWEIGFPVSSHLVLVLHTVLEVALYYVLLPYSCMKSGNAAIGFVIGYAGQTLSYAMQTTMALMLEREHRKFLPTVLCLPVAAAYLVAINFFGCVYGVVRDLLLFGNVTTFAPEHTLMKSGCERVAIAFRVRRFVAMCVRSVIHGDVPLGWFWLGWSKTRWTPSGFEGWTTGKYPRNFPTLAALRAKLSGTVPRPTVSIRPTLHVIANPQFVRRSSRPPPPDTQQVA